jgi:pyruvate dehydrogenase E1 component alpha subunit
MATETQKKRTRKATETNGQAPYGQIDVTYQVRVYVDGHYHHRDLGLSDQQVRDMYRNMLLQRRFEERAAQMYGKQKFGGFLHLYIGQEAISTGSAYAIRIGHDSVITAYRDHGIGLALGMTANECMAELFGKTTGCSKGKGGSMHYFSAEKGFYGGHGIVGGHVPVAVGLGFAHKYKEDGGVALVYFGDGAVGQGSIHEACNLASLYQVPILFIVENNQYAMGTAIHRAFAETEFARYAQSYNMPSAIVDGMDVLTVCKAMQDHVAMARAGQPAFLEIRTYRYRGHSMSDPQKYRTKEELEEKKNDDPILRLKAYLLDEKLATEADLDQVDEEVTQEVSAAVDFAEESPVSPLEAIYEDVYTQADYPFLTRS